MCVTGCTQEAPVPGLVLASHWSGLLVGKGGLWAPGVLPLTSCLVVRSWRLQETNGNWPVAK
jgi:hypothetical protein